MKKNTSFSIILFISVLALSCENSGSEFPKVMKMEKSFSECLLFQGGKSIVGLDPDTDKIALDLRFDHFVLLGDVTKNDELLCADIGKNLGDYGGKIFLLNNKGKIIKSAQALSNPGKVRLIGKYVFSDSAGYYENGFTAYNLLDLSTFKMVHEDKTLVHFVANDKSWIFGDDAFIGVRPNEAFEDKRSRFLKLDLQTLKESEIFSYTDRHPFYYFNCTLVDRFLVVSYIQACEIEVFDLDTGRVVAFIDLKKQIKELKDDPHLVITDQTMDSSYRLERPIVESEKIYFHIMPNSPDQFYQALAILDARSWSLKTIVPLEKNIILSAIDLSHVKNGKAYYCDHQDIFIYDANDGRFLKEISLEK